VNGVHLAFSSTEAEAAAMYDGLSFILHPEE
jgi:hypothetical protein